jgi:hypothetical protein
MTTRVGGEEGWGGRGQVTQIVALLPVCSPLCLLPSLHHLLTLLLHPHPHPHPCSLRLLQ